MTMGIRPTRAIKGISFSLFDTFTMLKWTLVGDEVGKEEGRGVVGSDVGCDDDGADVGRDEDGLALGTEVGLLVGMFDGCLDGS